MTSDSIVCANVQYRLLLSVENDSSDVPVLKALLQKSKGKGPSVAYTIYAIDQRKGCDIRTLQELSRPVTVCGKDGEGFSSEIPFIKNENSYDCILLTIIMHFD